MYINVELICCTSETKYIVCQPHLNKKENKNIEDFCATTDYLDVSIIFGTLYPKWEYIHTFQVCTDFYPKWPYFGSQTSLIYFKDSSHTKYVLRPI